ncbi:MAG: Flp pilus assembly protein CpaB [Candidatus Nitricoxidivorans perseverans]|uniref:Flp pilus assembly protein CpaB n=1 Tax=Candidatus Nitricoxidivorans perseverans TaxID=2975601 RepID=A0AA49FL94_9PROT|nr:MAG: Flp pilus assembly protein CpaB [Candidatus Nitricoxidivorans perseverans]
MTWLLRGLALVLAIGAVIAAFVGYRLSTQPAAVQRPVPPAVQVVQSIQPLRAGEPVRADDVALKPVPIKPAGSFTAPAQVVGQAPIADIAPGETLTRVHFPVEGRILRGLRAGERAVAIKVDDVVGLGGFAQPGDRVDVLLYLRGAQETGNASSAQVVLAGVRLLAYGESVLQPQAATEEGEGVAARAADTSQKLAGRPRTTTTSAVLAIPEAAASRLMLAASSGALRLSLRPAESPAAAVAVDPGPTLVRLAELAQVSPPAAKKPAKRGAGAPAVMLHEGDTVRAIGAPSR